MRMLVLADGAQQGAPARRVVCDGRTHFTINQDDAHTTSTAPCGCSDTCLVLANGIEIIAVNETAVQRGIEMFDGPQAAAAFAAYLTTALAVEPVPGPIRLNDWRIKFGVLRGKSASRHPTDRNIRIGTDVEAFVVGVSPTGVVQSVSGVQFCRGTVHPDHAGKPTGQWPAAF